MTVEITGHAAGKIQMRRQSLLVKKGAAVLNYFTEINAPLGHVTARVLAWQSLVEEITEDDSRKNRSVTFKAMFKDNR